MVDETGGSYWIMLDSLIIWPSSWSILIVFQDGVPPFTMDAPKYDQCLGKTLCWWIWGGQWWKMVRDVGMFTGPLFFYCGHFFYPKIVPVGVNMRWCSTLCKLWAVFEALEVAFRAQDRQVFADKPRSSFYGRLRLGELGFKGLNFAEPILNFRCTS